MYGRMHQRRNTLVDEHVAPLFIAVGQPHRLATNAIARRMKQEQAGVGIDTAVRATHSQKVLLVEMERK